MSEETKVFVYRDFSDIRNNRWIFEDEDGEETAVILPATVQDEKTAVSMWETIQADLAREDELPVVSLKEQVKENFFDLLTEKIQAGLINVTLKEIIQEVDIRVKGNGKNELNQR